MLRHMASNTNVWKGNSLERFYGDNLKERHLNFGLVILFKKNLKHKYYTYSGVES